MPRSNGGTGPYTLPAIYLAVPGTTILAAQHNTPLEDIQNTFNIPQPIAYGGTQASTAEQALVNLGAVSAANFLDAYSIGDMFTSAREIDVIDTNWLPTDGALYDAVDYEDLADLLPSLPDGVEWEIQSVFPSGDTRTIIETPSGYMLLNDDGTNTKVYTSTDGNTWSLVATISGFRAYDVAYGGGIYVAVDGLGQASVSNNGVSWSAPAAVNTFTGIGGVAYAFSLFVAVGDNGKISTSADGVSWTPRTSGVSTFLNRVRAVNGALVAVGATGTIVSSTNATAWTVRTSGVTVALNDVTHGGSLYVVVGGVTGGAAVILTSPDLASWTPRTSGVAVQLNGVTYSAPGFVAVGNSGAAIISTDALTWTSAPTGAGFTLYAIIADTDVPAQYYAVGVGFLSGLRTLATQFRVPDLNQYLGGDYGWIKALDD